MPIYVRTHRRGGKTVKSYIKSGPRRALQGYAVLSKDRKGNRNLEFLHKTLREASIHKGRLRRGQTKGMLPGTRQTFFIKQYWGKIYKKQLPKGYRG